LNQSLSANVHEKVLTGKNDIAFVPQPTNFGFAPTASNVEKKKNPNF
jgi:hypothetical protein